MIYRDDRTNAGPNRPRQWSKKTNSGRWRGLVSYRCLVTAASCAEPVAWIYASVQIPAYRKYCDRYGFIIRFSGSNCRRILRKNSSRLPNAGSA